MVIGPIVLSNALKLTNAMRQNAGPGSRDTHLLKLNQTGSSYSLFGFFGFLKDEVIFLQSSVRDMKRNISTV